MNALLAKTIDETCPKFNKDVTEGISKNVMKGFPNYLDEIFKSSIKSLSPNIPLKYVGFRKMNPEEEFNSLIVNDSNKTIYDLTVSDIYPVEYMFEYNGEPIRKPIYLPFSDRGNLIKISSVAYSIVPVLSDTVISPSFKQIFVRLLKDKLTFKAVPKNFIVNGEKVPGNLVYTNIVKTSSMNIKDNIGKPFTSVSLYLLGEYGIKETIKRYCKTDKFIVTNEDVEKYRKDYRVYESTKVKPRNLKESGYRGHDVKILIHNSVPVTHFLENFIFGIIYTLDILPEHAEDMVSVVNSGIIKDELLYWRIMLGRISYKNSFSVDRIVEDMKEHFDTLQGYIDNLIKSKLADNKIYVDNFFDLLYVLLENFNTWILNSKEYNSDINNRYIDILYYMLYDIILSFNKVILNINKRASKKHEILSYKEVAKIMSDVKAKTIFQLVKSSSPNLAIQLTESTTDLMYPKITALLEDQSCGNGVKRGSNSQFPEATRVLRGHDLYLGSLLFLTKTRPSPRFRANLYMQYNVRNGRLIIPKDIEKIIKKLDFMLCGRLENSKINILENEEDNDIRNKL